MRKRGNLFENVARQATRRELPSFGVDCAWDRKPNARKRRLEKLREWDWRRKYTAPNGNHERGDYLFFVVLARFKLYLLNYNYIEWRVVINTLDFIFIFMALWNYG